MWQYSNTKEKNDTIVLLKLLSKITLLFILKKKSAVLFHNNNA